MGPGTTKYRVLQERSLKLECTCGQGYKKKKDGVMISTYKIKKLVLKNRQTRSILGFVNMDEALVELRRCCCVVLVVVINGQSSRLLIENHQTEKPTIISLRRK